MQLIKQPHFETLDEDHVIWLKSPDQLLNWLWGEIILSNKVKIAVKVEPQILRQYGSEVPEVLIKNLNFFTFRQTASPDEDHVIWLKAPEQLLTGTWGEISLKSSGKQSLNSTLY